MYYEVSFSALPKCRMFGRYRQAHGWEHNGRYISSDLLIFVISGGASFSFGRKTYCADCGDWILIPANTPYHAYTADFCEYFFFHFRGIVRDTERPPQSILPEQTNFAPIPSKPGSETVYLTEKMHSGKQFSELMRISSEMQRLILHTGTEERLLFDLCFGRILLLLSSDLRRSGVQTSPSVLVQAAEYIQENYTSPLNLSILTEKLHVSKSYLLRIFRQNLGMTVTAYINATKLDYAAQLLQHGKMNISQVADYLAYSDSGYFSKLFHKRFGLSPMEYAKKSTFVEEP